MAVETRSFQAHTKKLLDLMIHSIYAHKDVFLRELISNASDAIDKIRFEVLTNPELAAGDQDWKIRLAPDQDNRTLTVSDNGIGMTYDEVVEHIGTIARSGSEAFAERVQQGKSDGKAAGGESTPDLIGQFGVGFYSAFMVAKRVVLETCKAGADHAVRWESTGDGEYTIERLARTARGTSVTLFLRETSATAGEDDDGDATVDQDFTETWTLKQVVKKYSDFIAFPVVMAQDKQEIERDDDGKPVEGGTSTTTVADETLNSGKALWTRQPSSIERADYDTFYKHVARDWTDPAEVIHFHAEGATEYSALLFVPQKAPFDLYSREPRRGLQLYVKRVFIAEDVRELVPEYLRFVKGLVDSSDLPLNVSREVIQQDRLVSLIKKRITNKVLGHLKDLQEKDRPKYEAFWQEFGACIKEGFHYDAAQKDKLADLLLVRTTRVNAEGGDGLSTLAEVAGRAREGQAALYFLTGEKLEVLQNAPQLEVFRQRGVEVILFGEPVDEVVAGVLDKYQGKDLLSAAKGDLDGLPPAEVQADVEPVGDKYADLLVRLKELLKDDVADVRLSERLTDSAVCLVADKNGMSGHLERMMQQMGQAMPPQKRILEVNGAHPAIEALRELAVRDREGTRLQEFAEMLVDQALLAEGAPLKNPARFARRVAAVMAQAAGTPAA